jgi:hypothetical protein
MKTRQILVCFSACVALLPGFAFVPTLQAQVNTPPVQNRLLLIFDTSSAMKKRLPAEEKAINQLFALTLNGRLRRGDTVGVWTFDQDPHIGRFPLQQWGDEQVTMVPNEIVGFLKTQHYSKKTSFDSLLPTLNQVVRSSVRLTTLIFCDGDGTVKDIPGTDVINASFKQHYHEMEKARVPFVIVLRSQFSPGGVGRYVGCTINSADSINIPLFPPLPVPPPPAPVAAPAPPPPLPPVAPLIIIGTNSEPNMSPVTPAHPAPQPQSQHQQQSAPAPALPPQAPPQSAPPASASVPPAESPAPAIPVVVTDSIPQPAAPPQVASIEPTNSPSPTPQTPATVAPPESPGIGRDALFASGAGLLIVVVGALYLVFRRSRSSPSLITESLKKR